MTYEEAIKSLELKFTSGNEIPVTRTTIAVEEFEAIKSRLDQSHNEYVFLVEYEYCDETGDRSYIDNAEDYFQSLEEIAQWAASWKYRDNTFKINMVYNIYRIENYQDEKLEELIAHFEEEKIKEELEKRKKFKEKEEKRKEEAKIISERIERELYLKLKAKYES